MPLCAPSPCFPPSLLGCGAARRAGGRAYSLACVGISLALFVAACRSDPGTVTRANAAAHCALYPLDGAVWPAKDCETCGFARPARSKHCRVCGR